MTTTSGIRRSPGQRRSALQRWTRPRSSVASAIVGFGALSLWLWGRPPGPYVSAQWLFSYADGLVRRSLVGTLFRSAGGDAGGELQVVAIVAYAIVVLALAASVSRVVVDPRGRAHVGTPLVVGLLVAPSGIPALAASLGQLDIVVVAIGMAAIGLVRRASPLVPPAVSALLTISILVHEAALFLLVPWVCAYLAVRQEPVVGSRQAWTRAALVALPPVLVVVGTALYEPALSQEAVAARLGVGDIPSFHRDFAAGVHFRGLGENLHVVWMFARESAGLAGVAALASVTPLVLLMIATLRQAGVAVGALGLGHRLLLLSSLSPLGLCVLAIDWGRWFAASVTLAGMACVVVLRDVDGLQRRPSQLLWVGAAATLALTLVVGGTAEHALGLTYAR